MTGGAQFILGNFLKFNKGWIWAIIHMILGVMATISPLPIIAWYYFLVFDTIRAFIVSEPKDRNFVLAYGIVYFSSFELIGRMSSSSPFIPYESSKYLMMLISIVGIISNYKTIKLTSSGFLLFLLIVPSLFIDKSGLVQFNDIVFNLFGLLNIAFAIVFFRILEVGKWQFIRWIRLIAFPIIPVLIYTFLKTPDFSELEFELSANFDTTGGFGSNQVSTVLGLGSFLFCLAFILNYRITSNKLFDLFFIMGFTIQGLLTFSRGGMIGTVIGLLTLMFYLMKMGQIQMRKFKIPNPKKFILPTVFAIVGLFIFGNIITSGNLLLRYQGQTAGTLTGKHEVDLNKFTSNRWELFLEDAILWIENPVFGSGAGASKYLRQYTQYHVAHVEISRLIAEHGLFGILIILLFFILFKNLTSRKEDPINKAVKISFFILAVYTTFHAATRTFVTPLLVCMSCIKITPDRVSSKKVNEKQLHLKSNPKGLLKPISI